MADNKKYYYLKLKEGFFDTEEMKLLQSMKDGVTRHFMVDGKSILFSTV